MCYNGFCLIQANAFPADELMPLSCKGRIRGVDPSRGDIDDALGNFSLTLVDSLDSLAVMGYTEEFVRAVQLVIKNVRVCHMMCVEPRSVHTTLQHTNRQT